MDAGVLIGAAMAVAASGVFPWINGEAVVVGAAMLTPAARLPVLVMVCACAQMAAKSLVYGLVRWTPERLPARAGRLLAKAERLGRSRALLIAAILSGSLVAIPPFYLVTIACGTLRVPFGVFAAAGLGGTISRYGLLAWAATALTAG
jgi:membrane protein YqaA with SNARE-associated domain